MATNDETRLRLRLIAVVALSLFAALTARLWYLQILTGEESVEAASTNITRTIVVPAQRGRILDANGQVLVDNRVTTVVTVNRQDIDDAYDDEARFEMFTKLAVEINSTGRLVKVADIERIYSDPSYSKFADIPMIYGVPDDLMVYIAERTTEFAGVDVVRTTVREYPYGSVAAHVLGYVGPINDSEFSAQNARMAEGDPRRYRLLDEIGKSGVELFMEDQLRGTPGRRVVEVNAFGELVRELDDLAVDPIPGNDVHLTLELELQSHVEAELEQSIEYARLQEAEEGEPEFEAPVGSAVVLNPKDGSVRAMASYPTFDPNDSIGGFSAREWDELQNPANFQPLLNRAMQGQYAPGSTFKLFTALAALEEDAFNNRVVRFGPDEPQSDPGVYRLFSCVFDADDISDEAANAGCEFQNAGREPHEGVTLPWSLTVSSDWYYYQLGEAFYIESDLNDNAIQDVAERFGFGSKTGISLPSLNESSGWVPTAERREQRHDENPAAYPTRDWFPGDNVQLAIGQSTLVVTPLQLANAYATFANGGTRYAPNVIKEVTAHSATSENGEVLLEFAPRVLDEFDIDPEHRADILTGLREVTSREEGTAFPSFQREFTESLNRIPNGAVTMNLRTFPVAGKTGTAQITGKADTSIFAAFAPADDPEYAISIIVEEGGFGSRVAAPFSARVLQAVAEDDLPEVELQALINARFQALDACRAWEADPTSNVDNEPDRPDAVEGDSGTSTVAASTTTVVITTTTVDPDQPVVSEDGFTERINGFQLDCRDVLAAAPPPPEVEAEP